MPLPLMWLCVTSRAQESHRVFGNGKKKKVKMYTGERTLPPFRVPPSRHQSESFSLATSQSQTTLYARFNWNESDSTNGVHHVCSASGTLGRWKHAFPCFLSAISSVKWEMKNEIVRCQCLQFYINRQRDDFRRTLPGAHRHTFAYLSLS